MHHIVGALLIGTVAGGAAGKRVRLRPLVRGIVKTGIVAKRKIESAGTMACGEMQKLVEEARAELDQAGGEMHS